jgi:hypothetical protein
MRIIEEHRSPDGLLRLVVRKAEDGDIIIGFDGYPWHTHPEGEPSNGDWSDTEAIRRCINRIISNGVLIAISRTKGQISDIWRSDDPANDLRYMPSDESIEFRFWNTTTSQPRIGDSQ